MRPVNLLPKEERRGTGRVSRTGPLAYAVVGVLVLLLAGVLALSLFNKQIGDREAEVSSLEAKAAETATRAEGLSSFVSFQQIRDARVQTVDQLARSRFDWERVLRELSIVLPGHVWLTSVTGTVAPGVSLSGGGGGTGQREGIEGPALELVGCGRTHNDVARLVAAMRDIDGVTRVTASDSAKPGGDSEGGGGGGGGDGADCRTRPTVTMFHLIAAFDGVPAPPDAGGTAPAPAAPANGGAQDGNGSSSGDSAQGDGDGSGEGSDAAAGEGSADASAGDDGGVGETEAQNASARKDAEGAGQRTKKARNLIPGG